MKITWTKGEKLLPAVMAILFLEAAYYVNNSTASLLLAFTGAMYFIIAGIVYVKTGRVKIK